MFGGGKFGGHMIFRTEVVNGVCPTCQANVVFVSLAQSLYRCTNCGTDLEQKVNGVISYIPAVSPGSKIPTLTTIDSDGPQQA
jgi:tRNA(Ile2) C34 agmatinyltransferase TiaS